MDHEGHEQPGEEDQPRGDPAAAPLDGADPRARLLGAAARPRIGDHLELAGGEHEGRDATRVAAGRRSLAVELTDGPSERIHPVVLSGVPRQGREGLPGGQVADPPGGHGRAVRAEDVAAHLHPPEPGLVQAPGELERAVRGRQRGRAGPVSLVEEIDHVALVEAGDGEGRLVADRNERPLTPERRRRAAHRQLQPAAADLHAIAQRDEGHVRVVATHRDLAGDETGGGPLLATRISRAVRLAQLDRRRWRADPDQEPAGRVVGAVAADHARFEVLGRRRAGLRTELVALQLGLEPAPPRRGPGRGADGDPPPDLVEGLVPLARRATGGEELAGATELGRQPQLADVAEARRRAQLRLGEGRRVLALQAAENDAHRCSLDGLRGHLGEVQEVGPHRNGLARVGRSGRDELQIAGGGPPLGQARGDQDQRHGDRDEHLHEEVAPLPRGRLGIAFAGVRGQAPHGSLSMSPRRGRRGHEETDARRDRRRGAARGRRAGAG